MGTWSLVGILIGLGLSALGGRILITGRVPQRLSRTFRRSRDAGLYHLLFGLGLLVLAAGSQLPGAHTDVVTAVLGVLLGGVAVVRYRPRNHPDEET